MMKYKNNSGKDIGFIVDGKTLDFQNGQTIAAPDNFKETIQKVIDNIVPAEEVKPVQVAPAPIVAPVVAKKSTTKKAIK
jgi:hypothetical protein